MTALFETKILLFAYSRETAIASQTSEAREEVSSIFSRFFFLDSHEDGKESDGKEELTLFLLDMTYALKSLLSCLCPREK
jgi:hypothetical protein